MNIKQIKYIHEVAKCGSIHKAAKKLYISQPNLTNTITNLETELGITIFNRTSKGVDLTNEGSSFISRTISILNQINYIEELYSNNTQDKLKYFNVSSQRFEFVLDSFIEVKNELNHDKIRFSFKETCGNDVIRDIENNKSDIGILIVSSLQENFFSKALKHKNISFEYIYESLEPCIIVSKNHPLSNKTSVDLEDLIRYSCVVFGDEQIYDINYVLEFSSIKLDDFDKLIQIYDRQTQYKLLINDNCYAIGIPIYDESSNLKSIPINNLNLDIKCICIYKNNSKLSLESKLMIEKMKNKINKIEVY